MTENLIKQKFREAVSAYDAGRLDQSSELCQQIVILKPDHFDALHLLAVVQAKLGRAEETLKHLNLALALQPKNAQALYNRGNVLRDLERLEEALASYTA